MAERNDFHACSPNLQILCVLNIYYNLEQRPLEYSDQNLHTSGKDAETAPDNALLVGLSMSCSGSVTLPLETVSPLILLND